MVCSSKQRILNRRNSHGRKTFKELLSIVNHQGNRNQNDTEMPSHTCQNDYD